MYDANFIKEMIEICKSFGSIHLFVNHFDVRDPENQDTDKEERQNNFSQWGEESDDDPNFVVEDNENDSDRDPENYLLTRVILKYKN